jgi:hypothetical protein
MVRGQIERVSFIYTESREDRVYMPEICEY